MDNLIAFITSTYDLAPIKKWEQVSRGYSNENYIIQTDKASYFLRGYSQADSQEIETLYRIEDFFHKKGVPLPLPLPTSTKILYVSHEEKIYSLFPFIAGIHQRADSLRVQAPALIAFGQMLATIHRAGKNEYSLTTNRLSTWSSNSFLKNASFIEEQISQKSAPDDFDRFTLETLNLKRKLTQKYPQRFEDYGLVCDHLIHGDYYLDNVLFRDDGAIMTVLDWDGSAMAPRSLELARSALFTFFIDQIPSPQSTEVAADYIRIYNDLYPISRSEAIAGLQAQFSILIHSLWIEKTHYLKQVSRIDNLMVPRTNSLRYIANNLDNILDKVTRKLT